MSTLALLLLGGAVAGGVVLMKRSKAQAKTLNKRSIIPIAPGKIAVVTPKQTKIVATKPSTAAAVKRAAKAKQDIIKTAPKRAEVKKKVLTATRKVGEKMYKASDRLSKNFLAKEMLISKVAGPTLLNWPIPEGVWVNMVRLATLVLQPARDALGQPIIISSGWRPADFTRDGKDFYTLLKEAGYSPAVDSDHAYGLAAGLVLKGTAKQRYDRGVYLYKHLRSNPNVRQVILYLRRQPNGNLIFDHIHVSVATKGRPKMGSQNRAIIYFNGKRETNEV